MENKLKIEDLKDDISMMFDELSELDDMIIANYYKYEDIDEKIKKDLSFSEYLNFTTKYIQLNQRSSIEEELLQELSSNTTKTLDDY